MEASSLLGVAEFGQGAQAILTRALHAQPLVGHMQLFEGRRDQPVSHTKEAAHGQHGTGFLVSRADDDIVDSADLSFHRSERRTR